jgi:hypothetical protein
MPTVFVATRDGSYTVDDDGADVVAHAGRSVTSLGRAGDDAWAILDGAELWRWTSGSWERVTALEGHRATCVTAIGAEVYVGSSEARLFRLEGTALEPVLAFDRAPGRATWFTPWGGPPDTRSIANWDDDVYVNVHVGGILRSSDRGATWTPTIDIEADVHHVTTAEGLVLAACAGGLAETRDGGRTWTTRTEGLEVRYARAVAVCGDDVLVSTSAGPRGGRAGVSRAPVAGGPFERCRTGLPEWFDGNIDTYCLEADPEASFVVFGTADGRVFASRDAGSTWELAASDLPAIQRVLLTP